MRRLPVIQNFPWRCGRNALGDEIMAESGLDNSDVEEDEIIEVDSADQCLEDHREYAARANAPLRDNGVGDCSVDKLDVEEGEMVEVENGSVDKPDVEEGEIVEVDYYDENGSVDKSDIEEGEIVEVDNGVENGSVYNSDIEQGEIMKVDSANWFPEGSRQYSPKVNASEESVTPDSDYEMKVNVGSALVEVDSAVQFQDGCGQFAPQVVAKLSRDFVNEGSDTDMKVKAESELNKPDTAKHERRSRWSGVLEVARSLVADESLQSLNNAISETINSLIFLGRVEDPEASELKKAVEHMVKLSGDFEPKTSDLSKNLNNTELLDSMRDSDVPDSKCCLNNVVQPEEQGLPSRLGLQLPVDSVVQGQFVHPMDSDKPQPSFPLEDVEESMHKRFLRRNRLACRDFPGGCGRRALLDSSDDYLKVVECCQARRVSEKSSNGRAVVLGLMAAPKCPWKQGKRITKAPIAPTKETMKNKPKKRGFVARIAKAPIAPTKETMKNIPKKRGFVALNSSKVTFRKRSNGVEDYCSELDEEDDSALVQRPRKMASSSIPLNLGVTDNSAEAAVARNKVRKTLRLFQMVYRKLKRDAEAKPKQKYLRIDLESAKLLKKKNKFINNIKILGKVPGAEVGDEFHFRVELAMIGLHHSYQSGINSVCYNHKEVATSIVDSGVYGDYMKSSDVLVYSGQGQTPRYGVKLPDDQKLVRGNLALKNSMDERTPVRVIRRFKGSSSLDARMNPLIYDGLYFVEKYWERRGRHGNKVFMFQLRRDVGQPALAIKELKELERTSNAIDISQGEEKMPIGAVNRIDDEVPPEFKYIRHMIHPLRYNPMPNRGCDCIDGCLSSTKCLCAIKNGGQIPFNYDGAIVVTNPLVYECGPTCKCPPSCYNRVSQHGIKFQLQLFKMESTGWGVRSLTSISSGSFICEYTGELLQDNEAEQRIGRDEYLFDIGINYSDHAISTELSKLIPADLNSNSSCDDEEDVSSFTIDAAQYGNVGRFINHSCSPNLYAQNVLFDHADKRMPHIMLFAAENIPPLQELTYHYNMQLDQVYDSDGNIKKKECYCGSSGCTGRMY
ncbi:hypothetical protein IFM89_032063 [Coptis chinensis]|uniref:Histone-lysine N-methyltransferase, H3 lysine-9 specific SUVH6 n=1 Tax=Coptis chinensis TaxID=261450 RepID=A0A835M263_9MAGN|nr:hypothetical protein IFM89_032063 [Coptis chinensis]